MNLTGAKKDRNQKKECQMCQKNHDLDACLKYKQLQVDDKKKFLMKSKACFGCYDVLSKEHGRRNCPKRRKCSFAKSNIPLGYTDCCQRKGHLKKKMTTIFVQCHWEMRRRKTVKACALTVAHTEVISMCMIPVKVKYKDSNSVYITLAMLDNCSQGCFINSSLVKNLRIKGNKTSVSVKTLTGERTHTSFPVDGLRVSRTSGLDVEWINIPKAYTNVDLLVDSSEIATPEKIKKWKYLQEISEESSQSDYGKVELLVGANCPRALAPVQVIASRDGGPYAMKTVLGWCIVGPIAQINSRNGSLT